LVAHEDVYSPRETGDLVSVPFSVCCSPALGPVPGLTVAKLFGGVQLRFTWTDVAGANEYTLYLDDEPNGGFVEGVGTATTGVTGIDLRSPNGTAGVPQFFLVAARNGCGEGPQRTGEEQDSRRR